ncbi:MAG: hypothetical protein ACI88H_004090 [Cocleimonas sp.]|jgi:hypothetical protein
MMLSMKFSTVLVLLLIAVSFGASGSSSECKDFLQDLNLKPDRLKFQGCKKVSKTPAILLESYYSVSGSEAKAVEDYLHQQFGLKRLRFVCCGWEGRELTYIGKNGDTYSINMYSKDEYDFQKGWDDYKEFRVEVGKYLVLP